MSLTFMRVNKAGQKARRRKQLWDPWISGIFRRLSTTLPCTLVQRCPENPERVSMQVHRQQGDFHIETGCQKSLLRLWSVTSQPSGTVPESQMLESKPVDLLQERKLQRQLQPTFDQTIFRQLRGNGSPKWVTVGLMRESDLPPSSESTRV